MFKKTADKFYHFEVIPYEFDKDEFQGYPDNQKFVFINGYWESK